jgi:hypothetical protein
MVHSQVAVLLPVGEARAMHLCILKADGQKNAHTHFKSLQTSYVRVNRPVGFELRKYSKYDKHQIQ